MEAEFFTWDGVDIIIHLFALSPNKIFFDDNEEDDDDCSYVPSNYNTTEPDSGDVLIKLNTEKSVAPVIVEGLCRFC